MGKRNEGLDLLKLLCAFLVISAHKPFPQPIGIYPATMARLTIPIFLMITGYFSLSRLSTDADGRAVFGIRKGGVKLINTLKLLLLASSLYLVIGICDNYPTATIKEYLASIFNAKTMRKMLLFNTSPFAIHLWYLHAVLYAMAFIVLMDKVRATRKILYVLAPFLIAVDFIFGRYSIILLGRYYPVYYTRNWLIFALPNLSIGMMLKEYDIVERTKKYHWQLGVASIILVAGVMAEHFHFEDVIKKGARENYIFAVFASLTLFLWFAQIPRLSGKIMQKLAWLGNTASAGIYIIHIYFVQHLPKLVKQLNMRDFYRATAPVVIFILSAVVTCLYNALKQRIIARRKALQR